MHQGRQRRGSFGARPQLAAPCAGRLQERRDPIHGRTCLLDRGGDRGLISKYLLSGCGYRSLDIERRQTPAVVDPPRQADIETTRYIVSIAALALARMARG